MSKNGLSRAIYSLHKPTYRLFDRVRRRVRPRFESDIQKHERERQTADYLLLSLTNCGRTWLRVIMGKAVQLHYGTVRDGTVGSAVEDGFTQSFEDVNLHDLFRFSEVNPTLPSIKPMHEKYGQFGNSYERQKVIVLVRDPRDAIISRYHQHKSELMFNELEQYVLDSADFDAYIQFYNDWQTHKSKAQGVLVVRYEDKIGRAHV